MMRVLQQAVSEECLFKTLSEWCLSNSESKNCSLRILSAFISGKAVETMEPYFDKFLSNGNTLEVIFGIDLNGTDSSAVERLFVLSDAYQSQVSVWAWVAPQLGSIFHPKLHVCSSPSKLSAVIGSANFTCAGICSNLESIFLFENLGISTDPAKNVLSAWKIFANPSLPLKPQFLRELDKDLVDELLAELPQRSSEDRTSGESTRKRLWTIKSRLPGGGAFAPRRRRIPPRATSYLLMDILNETRSTQVQPPAEVMEDFFGVKGTDDAELTLQLITANGLSMPIKRHVVTSSYMRRIEIPQVHGLARPCGSIWIKLPGKQKFAYRIIPRHSADFRVFRSTLDDHGKSTGTRGFHIGRREDNAWGAVSSLFIHEHEA